VAEHLDSELIVNVQGDEPLMAPEAIDAAVRLLIDRPSDVMSTLRRRTDIEAEIASPSVVKVIVDHEGYALYFSRSPIPFTRAGLPRPTMWKHMGLYGYRREFLLQLAGLPETALERSESLEQLRVLEHGYRISTAETLVDTIGVDTPDDLERARRLIEAGAQEVRT
jgi:3-deoxy-manno-octulosonate cytidylyltransferase (CMP-KDO synthetase)